MTELAFLEDPYRKTAITEVAAVHGQGLLFPRSIYYARSSRYAHPQPPDRGHLLVEGHKLKLTRVTWSRGNLVHVVRGPAPSRGARVLCHLDWERRHKTMRAHCAMHLLQHAVVGERRGTFKGKGPEVKGNGLVSATLALRTPGPKGVSEVLGRVNAWLDEGLPVTHGWFTREVAAKRMTPQHAGLDQVAPGEPVLRMVDVGDVSRVPCDAPCVKHTRDVGRVVAPRVQQRADGTLGVQFRVDGA